MRHIIIGAGEIGNTIAHCVHGKYTIYDKGDWETLDQRKIDDTVLNVCIPYSVAFVSIVKQAVRIFNPLVTVIHSTVKPGTTRKIGDALYSPVNGRHADGLVQTVKIYPKLFSGEHYLFEYIDGEYDLRTVYISDNTDELEYSKVMCTTYTGWNLIYEKEVYAECEKYGYNRERVYTMWNRLYNDGMDQTHPEWKRPIYDHVPGEISGHCIIPNLELVKNDITEGVKNYVRKHNRSMR